MQTANCFVYLGGDKGNSVPVSGATASEIAVLRVIHGDDAVHDIEPAGEVKISHRAERSRLLEKYGARRPDRPNGEPFSEAVELLFPGAAARLFDTLEDLDLPEHLFKPIERETAKPRRGRPSKAAQAEAEEDAEQPPMPDEDDGIRPMPKRGGTKPLFNES